MPRTIEDLEQELKVRTEQVADLERKLAASHLRATLQAIELERKTPAETAQALAATKWNRILQSGANVLDGSFIEIVPIEIKYDDDGSDTVTEFILFYKYRFQYGATFHNGWTAFSSNETFESTLESIRFQAQLRLNAQRQDSPFSLSELDVGDAAFEAVDGASLALERRITTALDTTTGDWEFPVDGEPETK